MPEELPSSMLVLFSSPARSDHTAAGLSFLRTLPVKTRVRVLLTQDAVLLALEGLPNPEQSLANVAEGYVLADHLRKRGFDSESLRHPFKVLDYDGAVDLMMADGVSVVGCF